ncbi:MAG: phosphoribosylformylglycinamidine synthase subunit PurS [Bacteroidetes bacterium]|nr:MAG: phosphoribosylformylglycinamidine synthase subunit PurS [Bacteroidota bacterium]
MKYIAEINVMPHKNLLDPQGKAVTGGIHSLGMNEINNVRVGKRITLEIDADTETAAREKAETICKKLLANPVMEYFEVAVHTA